MTEVAIRDRPQRGVNLMSQYEINEARKAATVAATFSAKRMRWNSMTKKLMSCSTSSKEDSSASRGMV